MSNEGSRTVNPGPPLNLERLAGRDWWERYCEIAANRMAQEVLDFGGAA